MATTFNVQEYTITYSLDYITIEKYNKYLLITGRDNVWAFLEVTDDLNDYLAVDAYFEINYKFIDEE
jgi:hypothetical protein